MCKRYSYSLSGRAGRRIALQKMMRQMIYRALLSWTLCQRKRRKRRAGQQEVVAPIVTWRNSCAHAMPHWPDGFTGARGGIEAHGTASRGAGEASFMAAPFSSNGPVEPSSVIHWDVTTQHHEEKAECCDKEAH